MTREETLDVALSALSRSADIAAITTLYHTLLPTIGPEAAAFVTGFAEGQTNREATPRFADQYLRAIKADATSESTAAFGEGSADGERGDTFRVARNIARAIEGTR